MVKVRPLRKRSVLDCLMETSMWLGDPMLGIKAISLRQRCTVESKRLLLQVNSLARRKPKMAGVKAAHSITWFPTWSYRWSFKLEFTRSRKREKKGRRLARSTYSPFVMTAIWLLER